jgi:hypothetical protein
MNRDSESGIQNPESSGREFASGARDYEAAVMARLKSVSPETVSHDLAPEILAKVKAAGPAVPAVWRWAYPLAAAAALMVLLGGFWLVARQRAVPGDQAVAWLCRTQESDGSWSTARWGGDRHFEVALTALSLMTLLDESGGSSRAAQEIDRTVGQAIGYLLRSQQPDGRFGEAFSSSPYNQGMATLALTKACGTHPDVALRQALDRAIARIRASQYADGGWGYFNEAHPASNLSITLWQLEALRLASSQGWPDLKPCIDRGLRWMAGVASDDGSFGYQKSGDTPGAASQTLTAMGAMSLLDAAQAGLMPANRRQAIKAQMLRLASAPGADMDYYRRYFLAAALKKMDEESARRDLSSLRGELLTRQVRCGTEAGSWSADDRWASSGGRIYATALASLSLR